MAWSVCQPLPAAEPAPAARAARRNHPMQVQGGDLAAGMKLLELWGGRPEPVRRFYESSFRTLEARQNATFADLARDPAVSDLAAAALDRLGGPLLGSVRPDGASVWVRTLRPAKVEVVVKTDDGEKSFGPVESTWESDLTAVVAVTGLKPEGSYVYEARIDGTPVKTAGPCVLRTPPADGPSKARIAFGSCFHRWGLGNPRQAAALCAREPNALLLYGDIAAQDRDNHLGLHRADYLLRDLHPAWQQIAANIPVYATWDDHDYFNNDKWGVPKRYTETDRSGVRQVFRQAWCNPAYGFGDEGGGVFFRTRIGPCDVIMLDHRYFREARREGGGNFLGAEQMRWLETQLLDCKGPFIILSCGTMWSDYVSNGKDSWGVFDPEGRERIFSLIEKHRIPGVLLVSGDRHGARAFRIPRPSGHIFYEFEPASLGGRGDGPPAIIKGCDEQLFGIAGKYVFGEFSFDATQPDPLVECRMIDDSGKALYELNLRRSQLTPPGADHSGK